MRIHRLLHLCGAISVLTVLSVPAARANTQGKTCYNCDNIVGDWECRSGGGTGGTGCTVGEGRCTVTGNCAGSSSVIDIRTGPSLIVQIAASHPRLAATLFEVTSNGPAPSEAKVFWPNSALTQADVQELLQGQPMGLLQTPGDATVLAATVQPLPPLNGQARALLTIVPVVPSSLDPVFAEFRLVVVQAGVSGNPAAYVPVSWTIQ